MPSASTILIAGASRGLGAALAAGFLGRGWNVIGTARAGSGTALHDLAEKYPGRVRIEALDIDSDRWNGPVLRFTARPPRQT